MRKTHWLLRWALLGILVTPAVASAQSAGATAPIPRLDASAALGWFSANEGEVVPSDNWYNRSLNSSVSFGYYWTEHLKTEIDTGLTTEAELNEYQSLPRPSPTGAYLFGEHHFSTRYVAVGQQFQFLHNAWFHPYVGAGVGIESVRHTAELSTYFPTRGPGASPAPVKIGPESKLRGLAFVNGGFKAYMTERSFFRSDVRVGLDDHVKHVTVTFGFGIDF